MMRWAMARRRMHLRVARPAPARASAPRLLQHRRVLLRGRLLDLLGRHELGRARRRPDLDAFARRAPAPRAAGAPAPSKRRANRRRPSAARSAQRGRRARSRACVQVSVHGIAANGQSRRRQPLAHRGRASSVSASARAQPPQQGQRRQREQRSRRRRTSASRSTAPARRPAARPRPGRPTRTPISSANWVAVKRWLHRLIRKATKAAVPMPPERFSKAITISRPPSTGCRRGELDEAPVEGRDRRARQHAACR